MLLNGYICLYRSLLSWEWHDNPSTGWLFVNLLLLANIAPANWHGITLKRGQVVTGRKALVAQTGLSERQVRTALEHLEETGELTIKTTNKFSLITIVNYGKFQDFSEFPTSKVTNNRPATDQQSTTKEKEEKENKKNGIGLSSFSEGGAGGEGIKKAAAKGLRKEAEELARKRRDNPSEAEIQEALEDVKHAKELETFYGMPKNKATRSALLDDVDRVGWEAVEKGLKDAAASNRMAGLSVNFYRTVLKNGTKEDAEWNQARDLLAKYFTLYGDERDNKNIQMVLDEAKKHDWYFAEQFIRRIHDSHKSASNGL